MIPFLILISGGLRSWSDSNLAFFVSFFVCYFIILVATSKPQEVDINRSDSVL